MNDEFMKIILHHECGEATGTCEFRADECVADEVEQIAPKANEPLVKNLDKANVGAVYSSAYDYSMITPKNQIESSENIFGYSGS